MKKKKEKNPNTQNIRQSTKFRRLLGFGVCLDRNELFVLQKSGQSGSCLCLCRASGESRAGCVWAQGWEVAAELAPPAVPPDAQPGC